MAETHTTRDPGVPAVRIAGAVPPGVPAVAPLQVHQDGDGPALELSRDTAGPVIVVKGGAGISVRDALGIERASIAADGTISQQGASLNSTYAPASGSRNYAPTAAFGTQAGGYSWCNSSSTSSTSAALGIGTLRLTPIYFPTAVTLTRIGAEVTVAGDVGSKIRLGVYADDGTGYPGSLVVDAGQIAGDAVAVQELTISQELAPGLYWVGGAVQLVTTTQPTCRIPNAWNPPVPIRKPTLWAAGDNAIGYQQTSVTGALPTTFTATPVVSSSALRILVKA